MLKTFLRRTPLPGWFPYRLRRGWDNRRIEGLLSGVRETAPMPVAPPDKPAETDVEVHILLCRRDLTLGLTALKSLLRFADGRFALAVTDDGSLGGDGRAELSRHFPGVRFLDRVESAVTAELAAFPKLAELYRGPFPFVRKLCHPILAARCGRVVQIDADVACLRRPDRLLDWAAGTGAEGDSNLFLKDQRDEAADVPAEVRARFAELAGRLGTDPAETPPSYFFNAGLLAFRPAGFDLSAGEKYLDWRTGLPADFRGGSGDIWFGDWTQEQTIYALLYVAAPRPAEALGPEYAIGRDPNAAFCHYVGPHLRKPKTLGDLAALTADLPHRVDPAVASETAGSSTGAADHA